MPARWDREGAVDGEGGDDRLGEKRWVGVVEEAGVDSAGWKGGGRYVSVLMEWLICS